MLPRTLQAIVLTAWLGLAPAALSKPAPTTEPSTGSSLVTRVYDIRGLLDHPRDAENHRQFGVGSLQLPSSDLFGTRNGAGEPGGGRGGVGPSPEAEPRPRGERAELLMRALQDVATWGDGVAMREFEGQLIVTQTPEKQITIERVLTQLLEQRQRVVTVRAHWVALEANQIETVTAPYKSAAGEESSLLVADLPAIDKLVTPANHLRALTTCFDGQTVRATSGPVRKIATDSTPVVGNNVVAYQSSGPVVQLGLAIELTPTFNAAHTAAVIEVTSEISESADRAADKAAATQPASPGAAASEFTGAEPPRIAMFIQHLHSTVTIPTGKAVVVGGMTLDPKTQGGDSRQMYLILEVVGGK
jgi:hypothetical protein